MSYSSDKPSSPDISPQDAPRNANESDLAPPAAESEAAPLSGLPSYMTGTATPREPAAGEAPAQSTREQPEPATAWPPFMPEDAVKAEGESPAIAVDPDDAAHVPPAKQTHEQPTRATAPCAPDGVPPDAENSGENTAAKRLLRLDNANASAVRPTPQSASSGSDESAASGSATAATSSAEFSRGGGGSAAPARAKGATAAKTTPKSPRPSQPSFGVSHPLLTVEQAMPPSMASRLYTVFALLPLLWLTLAVILQTLFSLNARDLWVGEETLNAALFGNLLNHGTGMALSLNGEPFLDKPPLYFWFLRGLYEVVRTDGPMLHFSAAALSCLLYLWAVLGLGRCVGRLDGRSNFASGIISLSTVAVMALARHAGPELLFAALVTASLILLYRSFVSPGGSPTGMVFAFMLAGAATLTQGPAGLAIPVLSLLLFALWRGNASQTRCALVFGFALLFGLAPAFYGLPVLQTFGVASDAGILSMEWGLALLAPPALLLLALAAFAPSLRLCAGLSLLLMAAAFVLTGGTPYFSWPPGFALPCLLAALVALWQFTPQRLFRADVFIGFVAGLAVVAVWPALLYLESGNLGLLIDVLPQQWILAPILAALGLEGGWLSTLALLPFLLLPWLLIVLFLPWHRLFGKQMREGLAASRRPEKEGLAFLWCSALAVILLVSALKGQSVWAYLPALGPLAVLSGRAVLALYGRRASGFRLGMALIMLAAGVLIILYGLMLFNILPLPGFLGLPEWKMASHGGFFVTGAILLVAGALIWFGLGSSRPEGPLLITLLTAVMLGYPLGSLVAPRFDALLSPRGQALVIKAYAEKGYRAAAYNVPVGAYDFYAATGVKQLDAISPEALAGFGQKTVLAMPLDDYESLTDTPDGFAVAHRQWMGRKEYVLLASPLAEGLPPAAPSYKPAPDIIDELMRLIGLKNPFASPAPGSAPPAPPASPAEDKPAPPVPPTPPAGEDKPAPPAEEAPETRPEGEPDGASPVTSPPADAPVENPPPPTDIAQPGQEKYTDVPAQPEPEAKNDEGAFETPEPAPGLEETTAKETTDGGAQPDAAPEG